MSDSPENASAPRTLVIQGASGFGTEVAWVADSMNEASASGPVWDIVGYIDIDPALIGGTRYGFRVFDESLAATLAGRQVWYHVAIGENAVREKVAARSDSLGWKAATLIHPNVVRAKDVEIGEGCYIGAGAVLSPGARIGRHVLVNQRVSVTHDAVLGDFSQACPGAEINGFCKLGRGALIGSNASMYPGTSLGDGAVLGANSFLAKSVEAGVTAIGVPARSIGNFR